MYLLHYLLPLVSLTVAAPSLSLPGFFQLPKGNQAPAPATSSTPIAEGQCHGPVNVPVCFSATELAICQADGTGYTKPLPKGAASCALAQKWWVPTGYSKREILEGQCLGNPNQFLCYSETDLVLCTQNKSGRLMPLQEGSTACKGKARFGVPEQTMDRPQSPPTATHEKREPKKTHSPVASARTSNFFDTFFHGLLLAAPVSNVPTAIASATGSPPPKQGH